MVQFGKVLLGPELKKGMGLGIAMSIARSVYCIAKRLGSCRFCDGVVQDNSAVLCA